MSMAEVNHNEKRNYYYLERLMGRGNCVNQKNQCAKNDSNVRT